jgi:hypothetical protein
LQQADQRSFKPEPEIGAKLFIHALLLAPATAIVCIMLSQLGAKVVCLAKSLPD